MMPNGDEKYHEEWWRRHYGSNSEYKMPDEREKAIPITWRVALIFIVAFGTRLLVAYCKNGG